ncbi:MAG: EVE domain-containing protein [Ilumatobacteraceae bacterium]
MAYWLIKSEPDAFSIDDLKRNKTEVWDGIRSYQARNFLMSASVGDMAFFYHSNAKPPGIVGLAKFVKTNVVDPTQFDPDSKYFDATSTKADPRWITVNVKFVEKFRNEIPLDTLKANFSGEDLMVVRKGMRLSVTPVNDEIAAQLLQMARAT